MWWALASVCWLGRCDSQAGFLTQSHLLDEETERERAAHSLTHNHMALLLLVSLSEEAVRC